MAALAVLAAAAAVVSWDAQYVLVRSVKHTTVIAALEAGIPDVGALIFAALGIALALHGKRALRARTLNVACVGLSLAMNALASAPGLARPGHLGHARRRLRAGLRHPDRRRPRLGDRPHPAHRPGPGRRRGHPDGRRRRLRSCGCCAWPSPRRPRSPGSAAGRSRNAPSPPAARPPRPARPASHQRAASRPAPGAALPAAKPPGKQDRLIALAGQRHDLTTLPLKQVSRIANTIGAEVDLSPGTARRVLLAHVRALQNGHPQKAPTMTRDPALIITVFLIAAAGADRDQVGVPAVRALAAAAPPPGPPPAPPAAPAAAPRRRARHRLRAVVAVGPVRDVPPQRPRPPVPVVLAARPRPGQRVLDPARPGALPARAAAAAGRARRGARARPAAARPAGWPRSSCATPARCCPPPPSTTCSS